jgi:hypothetical protein
MTEIIRKDAKERVVGDKSFVGDQEIVGKFRIRDRNFNIIYEFDPDTNTVTVYDENGNTIWQANTSTGSISGIPRELRFKLLGGGSSSGDGVSYYSGSGAWKTISESQFTFDPSDFSGASFYLSVVGRAGASGEADRTLTCRLYNYSDGEAVTGSTAQTTEKSGDPITDPGSWPLFESGAITFHTGEKNYVFQYRTEDSGLFVDVQSAHLIIRY